MTDSLGDPLVAEEPAPLQRRALAYLADMVTVATWIFALSIVKAAFWLGWSDDWVVGPWGRWFLLTVTFVATFVAYQALFIARTGATPGQDLMRLRTVDAEQGGKPPASRALIRSLLIGCIWLAPWVWPGVLVAAVFALTGLTDPHGRMIHDHLSRTSVVIRLVPETEPGQSIDEAEANRRRHFMPRFVNPIQITPGQMFRHPHLDPDEGHDEN